MKAPVLPRADVSPTSQIAETARQTAFVQCVAALKRTLATTPVGWLLTAWMCRHAVAPAHLAAWLCIFALAWSWSVWWLRGVSRRGPSEGRDGRGVLTVAALDGVAWGAVVGMLMGYDPLLDPWLAALLCGVGAVNAPVYITYVRAYRAQLGALWAVAMCGALLSTGPHAVALEGMLALTIFFCLIAYYMNSIAARVVEGIRLQLTNAQLAERLREALAAVEQDALTDALTGVPNRRALDQLLRAQLGSPGGGHPLSLLLLDVDHFKRINDMHGHGVGDDALRAFANRVRGLLRDGDLCARYGGEEFVVVLPATPLPVALDVAERLRSGTADRPLLRTPLLSATVSIGAAELGEGQTASALIEAADQAVYAAKRAGRNQVRAQPRRRDDPESPSAQSQRDVDIPV